MNSVIKGTGYILVHAPDMLEHNGTTQTMERAANPESEYLKNIQKHLRTFDEFKAYPPNQTYIGNLTPDELGSIEQPWFDKKSDKTQRFGRFGEIMPQDEFILLIKSCDVFDLVQLSSDFVKAAKPKLENHPLIGDDIIAGVGEGIDAKDIEQLAKENNVEPLYHINQLVGCVKGAHDIDINLSAHVMHENLVSKASSVLAMLNLIKQSGVDKDSVEYVIDCSEEACGDMNQRGGGNFAKAAAETAGLSNATGSDLRAFCAAPSHAVITAASLVASGTYKNVIVSAGGSTAKLGMNGKDHVKKEMPILEDALGGFAVLISANDGISPEIDSKLIGRHTVGTGSSPQAVITSLVTNPLDKAGLKITDIDKYSVEMQNPDITKFAGAGDVPLSNYKMIGALAVKRGELERKELMNFVSEHGMAGWAPTQGHIPSGVPYLGFACDDIQSGKIEKAMIIGKGSLFLGRMTNLFDGVSFMVTKNNGAQDEGNVSEKEIRSMVAKAMKEFAAGLMSE